MYLNKRELWDSVLDTHTVGDRARDRMRAMFFDEVFKAAEYIVARGEIQGICTVEDQRATARQSPDLPDDDKAWLRGKVTFAKLRDRLLRYVDADTPENAQRTLERVGARRDRQGRVASCR